ncbi:MAG: hypothetical protein K1X79_13595 [Oligoflexia bacterium]|nr:hypothetical protein [Oligoflexia bacterium]
MAKHRTSLSTIRAIAIVLALQGAPALAQSASVQPKFGDPLQMLSVLELQQFKAGGASFQKDFQISEGLGPIMNSSRCGSCHVQGGSGGHSFGTVSHFFGLDTSVSPPAFDPLTALGGTLLQFNTINWTLPQCQESIPTSLPSPLQLMTAGRMTPALYGAGLVDAIADADIQAREFSPPSTWVSGRANIVADAAAGNSLRVGRFGHRAQVSSLMHFTADALKNELGITNALFPSENAPNGNTAALTVCDSVADPEDQPDASGLTAVNKMHNYQRFLAPPPQSPRAGMSGETIFNSIGCADCHIASFTTANSPSLPAALAGKSIRPYSDFLLHDMGAANQEMVQGLATRQEFKTAPLWGLRKKMQDGMWHDGSAWTLDLALSQHGAPGSESAHSYNQYSALAQSDQDKVKDFLLSLGRRDFDASGDGLLDDSDLEATFYTNNLKACLLSPSNGSIGPDHSCAIHDIDQNGTINSLDYQLFLDTFEAYPGDVSDSDCDGTNDVLEVLNSPSLTLNALYQTQSGVNIPLATYTALPFGNSASISVNAPASVGGLAVGDLVIIGFSTQVGNGPLLPNGKCINLGANPSILTYGTTSPMTYYGVQWATYSATIPLPSLPAGTSFSVYVQAVTYRSGVGFVGKSHVSRVDLAW